MMFIENQNGRFSVEELCGNSAYDRPDLFVEGYKYLGEGFYPRVIITGENVMRATQTRVMLWEVARKLLGKDPLNYAQQVGDCVSFGAKNAIEHLQAFEIANGDAEEWHGVLPAYLYGTGRVLIGGGRLFGDGSLGVWQAKAVMQYGFITNDMPNALGHTPPKYSGSLARQWGRGSGPPTEWVDVGKQHLIQSAVMVKTWDEAANAIFNGYPVTIASNVGFDMLPRSDGYHHYSTRWAHQMCLIGIDLGGDGVEPHGCILNSWDDVHGAITDFRTKQVWPKGTLRVRMADIVSILQADDSFAYSKCQGLPARVLPRSMFDPW
jgi:hypothetical protein